MVDNHLLLNIKHIFATALLMLLVTIVGPSAHAKNLICEAMLTQGVTKEQIANGQFVEKIFNDILNRDPDIADIAAAKSLAAQLVRKELKAGASIPLEIIHLLKAIQLTDFEGKPAKQVMKQWKAAFKFTPDEIADMLEIKQILSKENRQYDLLDRFELENTTIGGAITRKTILSRNTSGLRPIVVMGKYETYNSRRHSTEAETLSRETLGVQINLKKEILKPGDQLNIVYKRGDSYFITDASVLSQVDGKNDFLAVIEHRSYDRVLIPLKDPLTKEDALVFKRR